MIAPDRFTGPTYLHLPIEADDPLDFGTITDEENCWNRRAQPTLYPAGGPGALLAELGRHGDEETGSTTRRIHRVEIDLPAVADLRDVDGGVARDRDRQLARSMADDARSSGCNGITVASMAFSHRPDKFSLAVCSSVRRSARLDAIDAGRSPGVVVGPLAPSAARGCVASYSPRRGIVACRRRASANGGRPRTP